MSMQEQAITIWTALRNAMCEDGMFAPLITQTGPATTQVLMGLVAKPTVPMHMHPQPGVLVLATGAAGIDPAVLHYSEQRGSWVMGSTSVSPNDYRRWIFINPVENSDE